eukprot:4289451-Pyramimonas_sp.AAC.1
MSGGSLIQHGLIQNNDRNMMGRMRRDSSIRRRWRSGRSRQPTQDFIIRPPFPMAWPETPSSSSSSSSSFYSSSFSLVCFKLD